MADEKGQGGKWDGNALCEFHKESIKVKKNF